MRELKNILCLLTLVPALSGLLACSTESVYSSKDRDQISNAIQNRRLDYNLCYEKAFSHFKVKPAGKIIASFYIENAGSVTEEKVESTTFPASPLENCILETIKTTKFDAHADPRISIHYPFHFSDNVPEKK